MDKPLFVTWEKDDSKAKALAMHESSKALKRTEPIVRSRGTDVFRQISPGNVSIRDEFTREDYEQYRTDTAIPKKPKDIIAACMRSYNEIGIIRNIIDLMADFATQGIDLNHPNERIEKFYKSWFRKVKSKERSERFLNLLYRTANVVVRRRTAKLSSKQEDDMRAKGEPDLKIPEPAPTGRREIPWGYRFLNPLSVDVLAEELTLFVGEEFVFGLKLPKQLVGVIKDPKSDLEKELVSKLPEALRASIASGGTHIPLDRTKVKAYYYKRDDWDVWAKPMVYSILADLTLLQQMKLADLAALDGAISNIRVWKIGNLEHRILPTEVAINRLAEMLMNNVGGGVMDLVWGPEIDLIETSTEVHRFLGQSKYEPCLTAIYAGLGIPPTLTGAATQSGFTNNFISLKTLIERLEYGRDRLREFWEEEIRIVQKAMGFRFPATLVFDNNSLADESARNQLLLAMADRDLISAETIQEMIGLVPEIEQVRLRRERRQRKANQMPPKASPFHVAEKEHDLRKIFSQLGVLTPSEAGLPLEEKQPGESSPIEQNAKLAPTTDAAPKGEPGQGRPKNKKDSQKRLPKQVNPRTSAKFFQTMVWAENAQAKIAHIAGDVYLKNLGKKTMRELTNVESQKFENYKFHVLCNLVPKAPVDEKVIAKLSAGTLSLPAQITELLNVTIKRHVADTGKEPPMEVLRRYQAGVYALWHTT